jgi:alpha-beta hydrolase superfamily lysophospholipase
LAETSPAWSLESFTASDGYRWRYRRYQRPVATHGAPRGRVICLHGIQSHAGWYEHSSTALCYAGFEVCFLDRRGSGLNDEARGDAPGFRRLIDDVAEFLAFIRSPGRDGSNVPLFLLGISWGGKLAAALQLSNPGLVDGLALLCPGFFPRVRPSLSDRIRIALAGLAKPTRRFDIPLNDPELFTGSSHWQDFIRRDPLGLRQATARLLIESVRLDRFLRNLPRHASIPVLLLLAGADRIIDNAKTRSFVAEFKSSDKEIIEYPGAGHTLEFEADPSRFIGDLREWLVRHCESPPPAKSIVL